MVIPVFKNVGERSSVKNYHPDSLFYMVSKVFEKDCWSPRVMWPFFWFTAVSSLLDQQQIFWHLYLIELLGLLTGTWHAGLLNKLRSYGNSSQIFGLLSSFPSNRRLHVVLDGKSSQEYPCWSSSRVHFWSNTFPAIH